MVMIAADARRRLIWDSASFDGTVGTTSLFTSSAGKQLLQQNPRISNVLPDGQRMRVDGFAVKLPAAYDQADSAALDQIVFTLFVQDNEVESQKLAGLTRQFPAGGGVFGAAAIGDDGVTIEKLNNGRATAAAVFQVSPAIVIDPKINFRVDVEIPTAIAGLTTGRIYVVLYGIYEFFLPQR